MFCTKAAGSVIGPALMAQLAMADYWYLAVAGCPRLERGESPMRVEEEVLQPANVRRSGRALVESRVGFAAAPIVTALAAQLGR